LKLRHFSRIVLFCLLANHAFSQDTLPGIRVVNRSGKVIVGWVNPFRDVVLINVQRSPDSLKNFKTILGVPDPTALTNGFLDAKAPDKKQYYRLFVQQQGGKYFFTRSYQPVTDSGKPKPKQTPPVAARPSAGEAVAQGDTLRAIALPVPTKAGKAEPTAAVPGKEGKKNARPDSLAGPKKKIAGTPIPKTDSTKITAAPPPPPTPPPINIYTNGQGQVVIIVPEEKRNVYTLKFFTDSGTSLFTLNKIRESKLTLEKTNFHNAGWYRCELYETDNLKWKYRVFIPKD